MNGKTVWSIIFGLVIINCFTLAYFLSKDDSIAAVVSGNQKSESIAVVGKKEITREDWMAELEERFGKETLEEMINFTVVEELAEKHSIKIPEEELERELTMYKSMYNSLDNEQQLTDTKELREQIRYSILLEELLTKDVEISDKELKAYYDSNKELYSIEDSYHLFHIVTETEEDALKVIEELKGGSSFEALAAEKSIDEFTANEGGELGFVSADIDYLPSKYVDEAEKLKIDEWSQPIKSDLGYSVLLLKEKLNGVHYSYEDVKNQMRRQIALEQMESAVSVKPLWEEAGVTWFYGDDTSKE
ncbi:peptidyl-prolyl cis-trans isomerase [Bacillus sp. F19]|nr:peptidyl-prolyl cis-trans isomerase [Bacillus sp. F19]